ncbi:MAG TPA: gamma-glutamylcyclotransferase [Candidatus Acidoferrum sp.]|nr:gamma-glutamylcyclotransferase [Candidatus Acidoferrum sp.]
MALVFQYGSNCFVDRINGPSRLDGVARVVGTAHTIEDYSLVFDVWSDGNRCATSDIMRAAGKKVWGVVYDIPDDFVRGRRNDGRKTLEQIEGRRYCETTVRVRLANGEKRDATTFVVRTESREDGLRTSAEYVSYIVRGLREQGVCDDYIREVKRIATENNPTIGQAVEAL